jgi:glycerol kinase
MSRYILAIDQGTSSSRAVLFDRNARALHQAQHELTQYYPAPGWVEHDPDEIWQITYQCCQEVLEMASASPRDIICIGISNQRETTVVWDKTTGALLHRAIVWQDRRTADYCEKLSKLSKLSTTSKDHELTDQLIIKTGLRLDPYFCASKIRWLLDQYPDAQAKAERGELAFGTIDTFLLWKFTAGHIHATDITNASRTLLFNLVTQNWDDELLKLFNIPKEILPTIHENTHYYGDTDKKLFGTKIPITAMIGDQQAALVGQAGFHPGILKTTYGTGAFCLLNTGKEIIHSKHDLLSTVAYKINNTIAYGLEGSLFNAGTSIQWLRDNLGLIHKSSEADLLASEVRNTLGVYFIPAFTGLGAPYWDPQARAAILGITRDTHRNHIVRAALEAVAYQTLDLLGAMRADGVKDITLMRVDGGMAHSDWLMQFLADMLSCQIERPNHVETSALGAAYLAGLSRGVFASLEEIAELNQHRRVFTPKIDAADREQKYLGWQQALKCIASPRR